MDKNPVGRPRQETIAKLIRMPKNLVTELEAEAEKEGMRFSAYVIRLLVKLRGK